jgi:hypothetical protein
LYRERLQHPNWAAILPAVEFAIHTLKDVIGGGGGNGDGGDNYLKQSLPMIKPQK